MHATIMYFATCFPDWNSLDSVRRAHSFLEGAALVFFALLVVCEALSHLSDDKKTERLFDKIGIIFFAIAVLAEIAAYPYGQRNDKLSADIIGSLSEKATAAGAKADSASIKSDVVGKQADAIQKRLDIASAELNGIEQQVVAQGPRAALIKKVAPELIKQLLPFHGQKTDFFIWRENSSAYNRDELDTWGAIANVLGNEGAKWIIGHGGFRFLDTSLSVQGVVVFVNSRALPHTKDAAKVLSDGLTKALPPSADKILGTVDPDFMLPIIARGFASKDSPEALVAQDATLIAIIIGERPEEMLKAKIRKKP
jgi:hypothetical protein